MVSRTPRTPAGPTNTSRAAGAAAPASAAATSPLQGATGGFYDPAGDDEPQPRAIAQTVFTEGLRRDHIALEGGGSADVEIAERAIAEVHGEPADLQSEIERIRAFRKPLGAFSQKLALPKRPGYHRHWFNDVAGRIDEAEANGWAHVKGTDGKPISRCVGTGRDKGSLYAFAMEIPEVFWQEDQDARNQAAAEKIDALKASPFRAAPGAAKPSDKGKFYDPSETDAGPLQVVKS